MKAPHMPPTEDPGLVASTPKGSDLELDALEKIARALLHTAPWAVGTGFCQLDGKNRDKVDTTVFGDRGGRQIANTAYAFGGLAQDQALAAYIATFDPPTILSLISAARKGQGEWRDIRSAPKDGTPFLAYRAKSRRAEVVRWVAPYEKAGVAFGGEFVKAASGWQLDVIWELHTHWMPLPPPSKQEE